MNIHNSSSWEIVTPQKATSWLKSINHKDQKKIQRDIKDWHVDKLVKEIMMGRFGTNIIHFCFYNDKAFCVNGNHTLNAIKLSKTSIKLPIERTKCNSIEEVRAHYARHDIGKTRSRVDIIKAYGLSEQSGISNSLLAKLLSSVEYFINNFRAGGKNGKYTNDEYVEMSRKWIAPFHLFLSSTKGGETDVYSYIKKRSILSIALLTFRFCPDKAIEFWKFVFNDGLEKGDPRKPVYDKLLKCKLAHPDQKPTEKEETTIICVAWNKFYAGDDLVKINYRNAHIKVKGVDFDKAKGELLDCIKDVYSFDKTKNTSLTKHPPLDLEIGPIIIKTGHSYSINGTSLQPVTKIVKSLQSHTDWGKVVQKESKRLGISPDMVRQRWATGKEKGTRVHKYIEECLTGVIPSDLVAKQKILIPEEISFNEFWTKNKNLYQYDPEQVEWVIGDKELKIGGTIDLYVQDLANNGPVIVDWKTGKFRTEGYNGQTLLNPFSDVPDSELHRYSLQLSLYRLILERNGQQVNNGFIIHLKNSDDFYEIYEVIDYRERLQEWLSSL